MARRIFISVQYEDVKKAKGFFLLTWNKNVDYDCHGRHLLNPVDSSDESYVRRKIREQINGTSVTVVLIGNSTHESDWVNKEIEMSLEKDTPNGIVGIRLEPDVKVPQALVDCGAEVIDWSPGDFEAAIERAGLAARRAPRIRSSVGSDSPGCSR